MLANILIISALLIIAASAKFRFDNYTLYRIVPENENHIKLLQDLQQSEIKYDFWTDPVPSADFVSVMASPLQKHTLESFLNHHDMKFEITMPNVQEDALAHLPPLYSLNIEWVVEAEEVVIYRAIDKEEVRSYESRNLRSMRWDAYYSLQDIEAWMNDIAAQYTDIVTPLVGGVSYEGREIKGLKISHGAGRKSIVIEAGIHSREWIVMSTACYIINELLTSTNEEIMAAARDFDWYIFPLINPDGYVWTHTQFRLWRKNRRPIGENFGVDLNRNWNNNWLVTGASSDPAADTYAGPGPFSEPETRTFSNFIRSVENIELYLAFHSFGQLLLIPFGNSTEPYANYHDAVNIGRRAMGALSVRYGTQYITGNIAEAIFLAAGNSIDWAKEHLQIPLVYCYELRDQGQNGFLLPEDQILPNHEEVMDSLLDMIYQARRFGYLNNANSVKVPKVFSLMLIIGISKSLF